jgi:PKD repeat protein
MDFVHGRRAWWRIVCFLWVFVFLPNALAAATYSQDHTPPYWDCIKWSTATTPYVAWGTAGGNPNSGSTAIYCGGWIGGAAASTTHYVNFYVPVRSTVKAKATFYYVGGTMNYGFGSFSGTEWQWNLDNGSWHRTDIEPAFTFETISGKIIDLVLLAAGGLVPAGTELANIVEMYDLMWTVYNLTSALIDLYQAGDAKKLEAKFSFTAEPGYHVLGVGLRGNAAGLVTGSAFVVMGGQLASVRLDITNDYDGAPDLKVQDILPENWKPKRGETVCFTAGLSNIGSGVADNDKFLFSVIKSGSTLWTLDQGDYFNFQPFTTLHRNVYYKFPDKGTYTLRVKVDPTNAVVETDESNNQLERTIYVTGLPPEKPQKPSGLPMSNYLYRNGSYTVSTSATDPDGDELRYLFQIRPASGEWFFIPEEDQPHRGWNASGSASFSLPNGSRLAVPGTYYLRAYAIDSDGFLSPGSDDAVFWVHENTPPTDPLLNGPANAYTIDTPAFTVYSTDTENDEIRYRFNWGDGSPVSDWYWPDAPGNSLTVTHQFPNPGTYTVQAQARDNYSASSGWTSKNVKITVYVPPPGEVVVTTNQPTAQFTVTGPSQTYYGSGTLWSNSGAAGSYTVTFNPIAGFHTPASQTKTLSSYGQITFNGNYTHQTGSVQVHTNRPEATFTVRGTGTAAGQVFSGSGENWSQAGVYVGKYTIEYHPVSGRYLPVTQGESKVLSSGGNLFFSGDYLLPLVADLDVITTNSFLVEKEEPVWLDGSHSSNPNPGMGIAKYQFEFGDGTASYVETETSKPDNTFDGKTFHVYSSHGTYTPRLIVYDAHGNKSEVAGSPVTVKSRPRADPLIFPSPAIAGENIAFIGRANDPDGDDIAAYEWRMTPGGIFATSQLYSTNQLPPAKNPYVITFRVQDTDGLWSEEVTHHLSIYEARTWDMFKENPVRFSSQKPYWNRLYGRLDYGLQWTVAPPKGPISGSPVTANLDDDWTNGLEIAYASQDGNLYVTDRLGNQLWAGAIGGPSNSTPAIDSLTTNGGLCVVVGSSTGVHTFDRNGMPLWTYPPVGPPITFDSTPVIADIDQNPATGKEIVIGGADGNVYCLNCLGALLWSFPCPSPAPNQFIGSAAVADIDRMQSGLETAIGCQDGKLYVVDKNGNALASWPPPGPPVGAIQTTPAIANLVPLAPPFSGSEMNIVFGSDDGHLYCLRYTTGTLTQSWMYPSAGPPLQPIRSSPAIGVVGEGFSSASEVVFGCDDGTVYNLQGDTGTLLTSFSCGGGVTVRSTVAIADIYTSPDLSHPTKGNLPEVVFGASDGKLYGVSFARGGQNLPWSPILLTPGMPILSSPAVSDINHDPDLEILIGGMDGQLRMLSAMKNPALVPAVDFIAAPATGNMPLDVTFTDLSTRGPLVWQWDFGDGSDSTEQNPTHTYTAPGTYTVTLTAWNAHGEGTLTKTDSITVTAAPVADFTCSHAAGTAPLTVQFTDQSLFNPNAWSWSFGDSGTSPLQNPSHEYTTPGTYTVALTATNPHGFDTATRTDSIRVLPPQPVADFSHDLDNGLAPLAVQFTDLSTGLPASWSWNFGDGGVSNQPNPIHIYHIPGSYRVSLTVSNARGSDTMTDTLPILIAPAADSRLIAHVPDLNQPPTQTLPGTNPSNFCAPVAAANITLYWDVVAKYVNALAVDAELTSPTVAEYIGYFMDTNNTGSVYRGNGSDGHPGTYLKDQAPGLQEFARWDAAHLYDTPPANPPACPPQKAGYNWMAQKEDVAGWPIYTQEIDAGRPVILNFLYWNPVDEGISLYNIPTGEEIHVHSWGPPINHSSLHNQFNPEEWWNLVPGDGGIGHAVTGVGYIENWDADGGGPLPAHDYAIVHDTWATTPRHLAIPWANWTATLIVLPDIDGPPTRCDDWPLFR